MTIIIIIIIIIKQAFKNNEKTIVS
jgi:hypothetical protein